MKLSSDSFSQVERGSWQGTRGGWSGTSLTSSWSSWCWSCSFCRSKNIFGMFGFDITHFRALSATSHFSPSPVSRSLLLSQRQRNYWENDKGLSMLEVQLVVEPTPSPTWTPELSVSLHQTSMLSRKSQRTICGNLDLQLLLSFFHYYVVVRLLKNSINLIWHLYITLV